MGDYLLASGASQLETVASRTGSVSGPQENHSSITLGSPPCSSHTSSPQIDHFFTTSKPLESQHPSPQVNFALFLLQLCLFALPFLSSTMPQFLLQRPTAPTVSYMYVVPPLLLPHSLSPQPGNHFHQLTLLSLICQQHLILPTIQYHLPLPQQCMLRNSRTDH